VRYMSGLWLVEDPVGHGMSDDTAEELDRDACGFCEGFVGPAWPLFAIADAVALVAGDGHKLCDVVSNDYVAGDKVGRLVNGWSTPFTAAKDLLTVCATSISLGVISSSCSSRRFSSAAPRVSSMPS